MAKKCKVCFNGAPRFAPKLRASGYKDPKSLICPICGTFYNSIGKPLKETEREEEERQKKINLLDERFHHQYWAPKGWR